MRRHPLPPFTCTWIEFDQPARNPTIAAVYIAIRVEPHVLDSPRSGSSSRPGILGRVHTLPGRILRNVVLHKHRLPQFHFVERCFLDRAHIARLGVRTEIRHQVFHQILTVLKIEAELLGAVVQEPFGIRVRRAVPVRFAHHTVDTSVPHLWARGLSRNKVFAMTDDAGPLRDVPAWPWGIDILVGVEGYSDATGR